MTIAPPHPVSTRDRRQTSSLASVASVVALLGLVCGAAACGGESADDVAEVPDHPLRQPHLHQGTAPDTFRVRLETTRGDVVIGVRREWSPRGADRFYNLVRAGFYDGVPVHRVVEGFIADFGIHPDPWVNAAWRQATLQDDPVRSSNLRGRVTFSKGGPDSRTTQVFVNTDDNPELDEQGFAPFGEVVEGMEVVDGFFSGYGDGPPRGDGVYQAMAIARGEEYFAEFPELDRIESARVLSQVDEALTLPRAAPGPAPPRAPDRPWSGEAARSGPA